MVDNPVRNVAVVGAGFIADYHLAALATLEALSICAICDKDLSAARRIADKWNISAIYDDLDELIRDQKPHVIHVTTPPPTHMEITNVCVKNRVSVFLEKPMALSTKEAFRLCYEVNSASVKFGVNHNALYFPAFQKMRNILTNKTVGNPIHANFQINLPLRQLEAKQHSQWMLAEPKNFVFETLYHSFTQIHYLFGNVLSVKLSSAPLRQLTVTQLFMDSWRIDLECEKGTVQLFCSCKNNFPVSKIQLLCTDGSVEADILGDFCSWKTWSGLPPYLDGMKWNVQNGWSIALSGARSATNFLLSTLGLVRSRDPFVASMHDSIVSFYQDSAAETLMSRGVEAGKSVIEFCERTASEICIESPKCFDPTFDKILKKCDVLVIGANGFIGRHLTELLVSQGKIVRVMVRRAASLPPEFAELPIQIVEGDILDDESLEGAMQECPLVYHLAATASDTWEQSKRLIVDGTLNVARACTMSGVKKLAYTSTIAAYYLYGKDSITESTDIDPLYAKRSLYARAKAQSEIELREYACEHDLKIHIFRPGVVVGAHGRPNHSAIGMWTNPAHVTGWGTGNHPVPLVLASDCAAALATVANRSDINGESFNLVGDVRITPREYVVALGKAQQRTIRYHPMPMSVLYPIEIAKWLVKLVVRRQRISIPSWRDLATRVQRAPFDTSHTKRELAWTPESDQETFLRKAFNSVATTQTSADS